MRPVYLRESESDGQLAACESARHATHQNVPCDVRFDDLQDELQRRGVDICRSHEVSKVVAQGVKWSSPSTSARWKITTEASARLGRSDG